MLYGTVLCLGDSLTFGARSPLGYPEHLGALLTDGSGGSVEWAALNRGISGETTRQILDRTPAAVAQIAGMAGPKWAVVLAGTNDSKGPGLDLGLWEQLYRQVLHWPRRHAIPLALCTLPPVRPGQMPAYTPESRSWLRAASTRVRAIAGELNNAPAPVRLVELEDLPESNLCDGVHLTPAGYRMLATRIARVLLDDASAPAPAPAPEVPPERAPRRREVVRISDGPEVGAEHRRRSKR